jgi:hypothetical protein
VNIQFAKEHQPMQHSFIALGFQEAAADDNTMWIIIGVVLVLLFFVVVIAVVAVVIFVVMRKRSKAQAAALAPGDPASAYSQEPAAMIEVALAADTPAPVYEAATPIEEIRSDIIEASPAPAPDSGSLEFDPSRTVAINREHTVAISYGSIKFVSGALSGQEFEVNPEGSYIGREGTLAQIVVPDPRISKRHMWIGVRDGLVRIVDQDSRNGTFVNDPKSERVTEATLTSGDTVILGESDVARFEYNA